MVGVPEPCETSDFHCPPRLRSLALGSAPCVARRQGRSFEGRVKNGGVREAVLARKRLGITTTGEQATKTRAALEYLAALR